MVFHQAAVKWAPRSELITDGIPNISHFSYIAVATFSAVRPLFRWGVATIQPLCLSTHRARVSNFLPWNVVSGSANKSMATLSIRNGGMEVGSIGHLNGWWFGSVTWQVSHIAIIPPHSFLASGGSENKKHLPICTHRRDAPGCPATAWCSRMTYPVSFSGMQSRLSFNNLLFIRRNPTGHFSNPVSSKPLSTGPHLGHAVYSNRQSLSITGRELPAN